MKRILALAASALACLALAAPAQADNLSIVNYQPITSHFAVADATAGYTNATTTPSDIAAATVTVPATKRPLIGTSASSSAVAQFLRVCYTADVTKATAGTGTINLFVNGSAVTAAARTSAVIGKNGLALCYVVARPVATAIIVKLQGVSSDTNLFTVSTLEMQVETLQFN